MTDSTEPGRRGAQDSAPITPGGAASDAGGHQPADGGVPQVVELPWRQEVPAPAESTRPLHAVPDASGPDSEQLTDAILMPTVRARPQGGWRGAAYTLTRGLWNPGVSAGEARRLALLARARAQLGGCHTVTVASTKGGVGKTTVATLLSLQLAELRGDRVIALDANPDAGTLAERVLGRRAVLTVRDLLNEADTVREVTDVARYTGRAGRLEVLASEQDPAMSEAFNAAEYAQVIAILRRYYNIIVTDTGTGLIHSAMHGALEGTRTLVVVGSPTVDGGSRASKTLDWLRAHGYNELVSNAVVALSCDRFSRDIDRRAVRAHFAASCRAVVEIPADPHLSTGGHIELDRLHPATTDAVLSLAAHVADQFRWVDSSPDAGAGTSASPQRGVGA